ncbi:MAG: AsmA family protein [Desulfuromusa sp.]|nr:AsmA family protein [Desulfuromusa sp.]
MSTPVKICIYIVSILVIIALALTVLVKTQITPEKVREILLPMAEKKLQRKVEIGTIKIGIFSGISLSDLKVMQKISAEGAEEFFSIRQVELHYQLFPLLMGKIVINKISLQNPKIFIARIANGQFNFSDLLPARAKAKKSTTEAHSNSRSSSKKWDFLIGEVNIEGGELLYVDKFKNTRSPFRYNLNKLNFKARQITANSSFPIDLSAMVNGSNIDISGHYDLLRQTGDLTLHLAPLNVVPFAPYYRATFPGKLSSAQLALELEVDIQPTLIASKGKVAFNDVDLTLDKFPDMKLKKEKLEVAYAVNFDTGKQLLQVSTLLIDFNGIKFGAEGQFNFSTAEPYMVSTLFLKKLDLREVMQNLPDQFARDYKKYSFAGLIDGQVDFSGQLDSGVALISSAQLKLSELRASLGSLRAGASGDINYSDNTLQTDNLLLQYGDQQVQLKSKGEMGSDNIFRGKFKLSTDQLDLNKILDEAGSVSNPESNPETKLETVSNNPDSKRVTTSQVKRRKTLDDDVGPFDIPVAMQGTIKIKQLIYKKLNIDKISADANLQNNNISISNLVGRIGKGELRGSSLVNFGVKGLSYQGAMTLSQPNVTTLVAGLFPDVEQKVSGSLQWQNEFSGRGTLTDTLLPALKLKGAVALRQGMVKGFPALDQLAGFLGNSKLKTLRFQSLTAQYNLYDGLIRMNGNLDSSKTKLISSGTVDTGGRLNFNLDALFAPEVLKKMGLKKKLRQSISDQDGWGTLPLLLQGTLDHPEVSYDSVALQDQLVDKASQKLLEKLAGDKDGEIEPIKKLLDNTLNKLFGK